VIDPGQAYPPPGQYPPAPAQYPPPQYPPAQDPLAQYPPAQYPPAQYQPPPPPSAYPPPPGYPPAPGYPAPQAPQQYPPQQYAPPQYPPPQYAPQPAPAYPPAAPGLTCRYCGATPALKATARGHRGMVVVMQFRSAPGPFCRDCGTALVRKLASDTMWQGWWGYFSFLATPVVLVIDFVLFLRLSGLAWPVRAQGSPAPLDKGRPVFLRPGALGLLLPLALVCWLALAIINQ
jgi:hypothetical protein